MKNMNNKTKLFSVLFVVMMVLAGLAFNFGKLIATILFFAIAVVCAFIMVESRKKE